MLFLRVFKHLLPSSKAWSLTAEKALRRFFAGLAGVGEDVQAFVDLVWSDILPAQTRQLTEWEQQFALPNTGITTQQRRDRLDATWKALGGQSARYIQDTLQNNGFDVYVHEWWVPGTEPAVGVKQCVTPRSPLLYLRREYTGAQVGVDCGEALAACGEAFAEAGNGVEPRGYPLVNKIFQTEPNVFARCGEAIMGAGEELAACNNYFAFTEKLRDYTVPSDVTKWPYFLYIGAPSITSIAQLDPKRRDEFEALCLKICPAQQWLGILAEYT